MNLFTKNPIIKKTPFFEVCVWGGGARVSDFFYKESKSKKKKNYLYFFLQGWVGGGGGGRWGVGWGRWSDRGAR